MDDLTQIEVDTKRLRHYRELKQLSQNAAASRVGVKKAAISKYELGQITPSGDVLARLCILYEINITDIAVRAV
jgi:transcriptional regulator with XRE-family HTH domain